MIQSRPSLPHAVAEAARIESAAKIMMSATSLGCETIDAWLAGTVRTVAPIRFAKNSSACGGDHLYFAENKKKKHLLFLARGADLPSNHLTLHGPFYPAPTPAPH